MDPGAFLNTYDERHQHVQPHAQQQQHFQNAHHHQQQNYSQQQQQQQQQYYHHGYQQQQHGGQNGTGHEQSFAGANKTYIMTQLSVPQVRQLHAQALAEAEAKRTELKLVVTSRYKELVGSSDEVQSMQQLSKQLYSDVQQLPKMLTQVQSLHEASQKLIQDFYSKQADAKNVVKTKKEGPKTLQQLIHQHILANFSSKQKKEKTIQFLRSRIHMLPRRVHRALFDNDPHLASLALVEIMTWIALLDTTRKNNKRSSYPLAHSLCILDPQEYQKFVEPVLDCESKNQKDDENDDKAVSNVKEQVELLLTQMHMTYLQLQIIPQKAVRMANAIIARAPSSCTDSSRDYSPAAGALVALALLDPTYKQSQGGCRVVSPALLLDFYYDSKSKLLSKLLDQVEQEQKNHSISETESLLEKLQTIVRVIQQDVILHSSEIFLDTLSKSGGIPMELEERMVKAKCSRFLAAHLALVHNRLRSILSSIHTAGYLAKIRQALYQQTNSFESEQVKAQWVKAVSNVVDLRVILHTKDTTMTPNAPPSSGGRSWITASSTQGASSSNSSGGGPTFSLWSILFSQTFDSLVENLLRHSCVALHNTLLSTLMRSLSLAPRTLQNIRSHEALRNCNTIVATLDESLRQLSEDAWKLVHSEERHVSSVALRQSLFVQTCETLARLLCQLRWLVSSGEQDNAVKDYIVGRLCYLLKYRLQSLQTLLDPTSAPWFDSSAGASMITMEELQSSFEIADDDDDGMLSLEEAAECLEAAFSGCNFNTGHVVETMKQMSSVTGGGSTVVTAVNGQDSPSGAEQTIRVDTGNAKVSVTLQELALLTARGIRYENTVAKGDRGGLFARKQAQSKVLDNPTLRGIQCCLDSILETCWNGWAKNALTTPLESLESGFKTFQMGWSDTAQEWLRRRGVLATVESMKDNAKLMYPKTVSPFVISFLLSASMEFNKAVCPNDFMLPVKSIEEAQALGVSIGSGDVLPPPLVTLMRRSLCKVIFLALCNVYHVNVIAKNPKTGSSVLKECSMPCLLQLEMDVSFVQACAAKCDSLVKLEQDSQRLEDVAIDLSIFVSESPSMDQEALQKHMVSKQQVAFASCKMFLSSLFGTSFVVVEAIQPSDEEEEEDDEPCKLLPVVKLESNVRFAMLPVPSDRELNELLMRAQQKKTSNTTTNNVEKKDELFDAPRSGGFGFFQSMTTKWKK